MRFGRIGRSSHPWGKHEPIYISSTYTQELKSIYSKHVEHQQRGKRGQCYLQSGGGWTGTNGTTVGGIGAVAAGSDDGSDDAPRSVCDATSRPRRTGTTGVGPACLACTSCEITLDSGPGVGFGGDTDDDELEGLILLNQFSTVAHDFCEAVNVGSDIDERTEALSTSSSFPAPL